VLPKFYIDDHEAILTDESDDRARYCAVDNSRQDLFCVDELEESADAKAYNR
jgi:hypothetical protein